ncbi:MAG: Cys-tRNA(Pro) deacylase [Eggerthellaceae bacterium]|nr:Cys-tRNA(Pro) deacylase [Eggerthellaceae bacterium]
MPEKIHKTNAMRLLESAGIVFDVVAYEVDESDLSGVHAAAAIGADPDTVFKTLVLSAQSGGHVVCCIPVAAELDLKKAARAAGEKSLQMLPMKQLCAVTGYVRGGCSPLGMKKQFPTFVDETAVLFDRIGVSAGERGLQILANPEALALATGAQFADLVR